MKGNTFRIILLLIVFLGILYFPFVNRSLNLIKDPENGENRRMADFPVFDISFAEPFPAAYEKWYNDNFTFRSRLVKWYSKLKLFVFDKSPIPEQAVIGKDGWLFLGGNELKSYQGIEKLSPLELETLKSELEYRKYYLEARGIRFYVLVTPGKGIVYSDKMPGNILRKSKESWGQQVNNYLKVNSVVKPIDIYEEMKAIASKEQDNLYLSLDNHWTEFGAFFAANEVLKRIHEDMPAVDTLKREDFKIRTEKKYLGNISGMFSVNYLSSRDTAFDMFPVKKWNAALAQKRGYPMPSGFPYPDLYEEDREIANSQQPRILVISDSFGTEIFPFISERFSRSIKIFDGWCYKLNENIVEAERPDVVLLMVLEANIRNILANRSTSTKQN